MKRATILPGFWSERLAVNTRQAIFHQWEQLEASGCIANFRIAAGEAEGWREGWFFADSDAYKWLDAAARIWASGDDVQMRSEQRKVGEMGDVQHLPFPPLPQRDEESERLGQLMADLIDLLGRAQMPDGYLFTYNQIHFPDVRWQNLQIEHELYCHGHLIEAGVSHFEATGQTNLLAIVRKAADRIVEDFRGKGPAYTPGHEEIEIALLRLFEVTQEKGYLEMARQFIEQRGRIPFFGWSIYRQNQSVEQRKKQVQQDKLRYLKAHPDYQPYQLPPGNRSEKPPFTLLRWFASGLSGKYQQQHAVVRQQTVPEGHAVRFAYLETAVAMLARLSGDPTLLPTLEQAWERMVTRRMYVTGGLGSQPAIEGFGRDFDLVPEYAYAETCAALGSLFWNWEMAQLTGAARYSELFEWQLYNAAAVGMGLDGTTYLYNNPLACRGGVTRQPWYAVPCCPSNLSRTWADLGKYIFTTAPDSLNVHQYINSAWQTEMLLVDGKTASLRMEMETGLPWEGWVRLRFVQVPGQAQPFALQLRQPAWASKLRVRWHGEAVLSVTQKQPDAQDATASGYDPRLATFHTLRQDWEEGDVVEIAFDMPVHFRRAHPRVKGHRGKAAVSRGPLVYCLESVDNPGIDIFSARLDPESFTPVFDAELLGGMVQIQAKTSTGENLTFIPYFLWGNRGPARMTVWTGVLTGK